MTELDRLIDTKTLLDLLRECRIAADLRQVDVAERLGVPQSMVSKYEVGERRLDFLEVRELCLLFGVPMVDFVERFEVRKLGKTDET